MAEAREKRDRRMFARGRPLDSKIACMHETLVCAALARSIAAAAEDPDDTLGIPILFSIDLAERLEALWAALDRVIVEPASAETPPSA